ncbi:MAG: glycosyltransferase family 2 protein [Erythrobacter sp.]|uniref:glycosyltransferase family 2 protein n=1 Tax=Erythrobacter sp. TaxID=1042 RepID=UPI003C78BC44
MTDRSLPASARVQLPGSQTHDISVVIVSYNTRELTIECVRSVLADSEGLAVEVIVVDNQSSDGSSEALSTQFPGITVIDSPANGGFAYGNNIGFEHCHGRYVLLLNPDTRVKQSSMRRCVELMGADPEIGVIGATVRTEDGELDPTLIRFYSLRHFAYNVLFPARIMSRSTRLGDPRYAGLDRTCRQNVDAVAGCFMFTRREVLEDAGGLDTRFFMYGEEVEWCFRVRQAGYEIVYDPAVEIVHVGGASTAGASEWQEIETMRGHILFLLLTNGSIAARGGSALMVARELLRSPYYAGQIAMNRFTPTEGSRKWLAKIRFAFRSVLDPPRGQTIGLPGRGGDRHVG